MRFWICSSVKRIFSTSGAGIINSHYSGRMFPVRFSRTGRQTKRRQTRALAPPGCSPSSAADPAPVRGAVSQAFSGFRSLDGSLQAVFENQILKVLLVKDLHVNLGIELAEPFDLAIFSRHQRLLHGRQFDIKIKFRQIKIRRERLDNPALLVPLEGKRTRLILPGDPVEIQKIRENLFAGVSETAGGQGGVEPEPGKTHARQPQPDFKLKLALGYRRQQAGIFNARGTGR